MLESILFGIQRRADDKQVPCGMTLLVESVMLEASCLEFSVVLDDKQVPCGMTLLFRSSTSLAAHRQSHRRPPLRPTLNLEPAIQLLGADLHALQAVAVIKKSFAFFRVRHYIDTGDPSMSSERPAPKQYETWLKQLVQQRFEQASFKVEKELAVGGLPLRIDMIARDEAAADFSALPEIFRHFRRYNVIELKSEADDLTAADLLKLHAYGWLYMESNRIYTIREVTLTALVHHLTPAVLNVLPALGYVPLEKGIYYQFPSAMESRLICFGDLPDERTPEELRAFSSPARRRPIIMSELERGKSTLLLEAIFELYQSEVYKIMALKQETIQRCVEAVGREKFLAVFNKQDHLAALSKEDHLAALSKEKEGVLQYFLAELGPDEFQRLIAKISRNKSESH